MLLPKLLSSELLKLLSLRLEQQQWVRRIEEDIATEDVLDDGSALGLLHFVTNTPDFLEAVRSICACTELTTFRGRVYRFVPNSIHHDSWHDDVGDEMDRRVLGMSVNLGSRRYAGGILQMRERDSERMVFEIANTGWGDATLFRISDRLEHQVTTVTGSEPRTAFAGWFRSHERDFFSSMRRASAP